MNELKSLLTLRNPKLPKTTATFNMSEAMKCPADALGLCAHSKECYAKKAERLYPEVLPFRARQREYWLGVTADQYCDDFLESVSRKRIKITAHRLNESGDFHSQECVDKAEAIAKRLKKHGILVYTYTCRDDLNFDNVKYLILTGSNQMIHNRFWVVNGDPKGMKAAYDATHPEHKSAICPGSCRKCKMCQTRAHRVIFVKKH